MYFLVLDLIVTYFIRTYHDVIRNDRCAMYSSVSGPAEDREEYKDKICSGVRRDEEAMKYLEPPMSIDRGLVNVTPAR